MREGIGRDRPIPGFVGVQSLCCSCRRCSRVMAHESISSGLQAKWIRGSLKVKTNGGFRPINQDIDNCCDCLKRNQAGTAPHRYRLVRRKKEMTGGVGKRSKRPKPWREKKKKKEPSHLERAVIAPCRNSTYKLSLPSKYPPRLQYLNSITTQPILAPIPGHPLCHQYRTSFRVWQ